jgi:hypothetical protein
MDAKLGSGWGIKADSRLWVLEYWVGVDDNSALSSLFHCLCPFYEVGVERDYMKRQ